MVKRIAAVALTGRWEDLPWSHYRASDKGTYVRVFDLRWREDCAGANGLVLGIRWM